MIGNYWWMGEYVAETVGEALRPIYKTAGNTITSGTLVSLIDDIVYNPYRINYADITDASNLCEKKVIIVDSSRVLVIYESNIADNAVKAVIFSISGNSLTAGTPVTVSTGETTTGLTGALIDTDKVLIAIGKSGNSEVLVLSINGTSITAGTPVVFLATNTPYYPDLTKLDTNKALLVFADGNNSQYGTARAMTISGTTITLGTAFVFESADVYNTNTTMSVVAVNTSVAVVCFSDIGNGKFGTATILSISGTTITKGQVYVFHSKEVTWITATLIDANKVLLCYVYRPTTSTHSVGAATILTVSGTTFSGTPTIINTGHEATSSSTIFAYNIIKISTTQALLLSNYNSLGTANLMSISGTEITMLSGSFCFEPSEVSKISSVLVSSGKVVIIYSDAIKRLNNLILNIAGSEITAEIITPITGLAVTASAYINGTNKVGYQSF